MKREDVIEVIKIVFLSVTISFGIIYPFKFYKLEKEMNETIKENIELKQEINELEKENYKLNFDKSLERTCGLQSVQCDNE